MTVTRKLRQQRLPPLFRDEVDERFIHRQHRPAALRLLRQQPEVVQRILDAIRVVRLSEEQQIHLFQQSGDALHTGPVALLLRPPDREDLRTELLRELAVLGEAGLDDPYPARNRSQQQQSHRFRRPVAYSNPFDVYAQTLRQQGF
ncbi:hypothetical protein D3C73_878910 [compost metagenome]